MADDIAISVEHVSKAFKLPHEKQTSIKGALINKLRGGNRSFEKQEVLKDISFEIKKGEFFGIVGRNGSGKSTLLKLLAGIYTPTGGSITVNGKLTPFIELGVGFNPELTGRENVFLNGALLGFSRKEMQAMYHDIVAFAELDEFMDQKLKNYSSGMQVRLAFSVAIRAETDILLIDEVLAVGDQSFQEKCFDYFATIKNSDKTVVFVTHDMSNVERFCNRAFVLDKKKEVNGLYSIPDAVKIYNQLNHEKPVPVSITGRKKEGVHISAIRLLGQDGKTRDSYEQGESLTVELDIENGSKTEDITIGLAFYDSDNINLAGPNSRNKKIRSSAKTVRYSLDKIPFNMGEYYLTVALFDRNGTHQYDLVDKAVRFFVNTSQIRFGKIVLEDKWSNV